MTTTTTTTALVLQISIISSHESICKKPIYTHSLSTPKFAPLQQQTTRTKLRAFSNNKWSFFEVGRGKDEIFMKQGNNNVKRQVFVKSFNNNNQGFGFNNNNNNNGRVIGNLVLAIGLTYLTLSGQLGWILDAIVSVSLFVVVAPIVGLGVFLWWAGKDIVQSSCPSCGNDFQVFKSTMNEEQQLCPFCSAPFSVVDGKFVSDSVNFSNESTPFGQTFNDFSPSFKKGKDSSTTIVDVEAEIRDAD
ncbi:hypothetical protein ACFE04_024249 [Oxalis oulophora]